MTYIVLIARGSVSVRARIITVSGLCAAVLAAATAAVVLTTNANAVADGEPVKEGQYRFATKLVMKGIPNDRKPTGLYDSACSGALVAPQWIATAGHCFHTAVVGGSYTNASGKIGPTEAIPYASVTAILGRATLTGTGGHEVAVVEAYQAGTNDIAIAKLARPVMDIAPIKLSRATPKVGDILRIAGWGGLSNDPPDPVQPRMQTGQVKVTSTTDTLVNVVGYAPQSTTSACLYDSGAPYFSESPSGGERRLVSIERGNTSPDCPHAVEEDTSRVDVVAGWIYKEIDPRRH